MPDFAMHQLIDGSEEHEEFNISDTVLVTEEAHDSWFRS